MGIYKYEVGSYVEYSFGDGGQTHVARITGRSL